MTAPRAECRKWGMRLEEAKGLEQNLRAVPARPGLGARGWISLLHEFQCGQPWNQPQPVGPAQETSDRFPALLAIIEGPMIHIHAHEFIGQVTPHVAGVLESMLDSFRAVVETVLNAGGQQARESLARGDLEALVDDVSSQREGQSVILFTPPGA
jgi:hypothetical protein